MKIDIQQEALSKEAIADKISVLDGAIAKTKNKHSRTKWTATIIVLLYMGLAIGSNFLWAYSPWKELVVTGAIAIAIAIAIAAAAAGAVAVAAAAAAAIAAAAIGAIPTTAALTIAVAAAAALAYGVVEKIKMASSEFLMEREGCQIASAEACQEIEKWQSDATIAQFRDAVQAQGRQFINAEIDAMRDWHEGLDVGAGAAEEV